MASPENSHPFGADEALEQLGSIALTEHSLHSVLQTVADLPKRVIPGAIESSVSVLIADDVATFVHTGRLALDLDETQYGRGYGPCLHAAVGQEIREITDARKETRSPDYARTSVERGSLSSLSVPVPVREAIHGGLNLYAVEAHAFDDNAKDGARTFASYAAVTVRNMHLYESTRELAENLDIAMRTRRS